MQAVLLAAGASSRFWPLNKQHKSLLVIGGKPLIRHTLDGLDQAGINSVVIVQGPEHQIEHTLDAPDGMAVSFVTQDTPRGMGDALEQARDHLTEPFVVASAYRTDIASILAQLETDNVDGAVAGTRTAHPGRYGMLDIEGGRAVGVVEKPAAGEEPSAYKIRSTYVLRPDFFTYLDAVEPHEYHFEDALNQYMHEKTVSFTELDTSLPSLKYPWDTFGFINAVLDAQEPVIADSATIAESATIEGNVVIDENAHIYEHAVVRGPCYIGQDAVIGNNAVVRDYTALEAGARVGANAEVRGSLFQPGASCHSGFVGDSILGRDVAIGAGTVIANRGVRQDGERPTVSVHVKKHGDDIDTGRDRLGAFIGDQADIGTQANIMPGTCIGAGAFIGPSALVRENVDEEQTMFNRVTREVRER